MTATIERSSPRLDLTESTERVSARLREILRDGGSFTPVYRHILAVPGKRLRSRLVLATAAIGPRAPAPDDAYRRRVCGGDAPRGIAHP